jgi:hypothetical protein
MRSAARFVSDLNLACMSSKSEREQIWGEARGGVSRASEPRYRTKQNLSPLLFSSRAREANLRPSSLRARAHLDVRELHGLDPHTPASNGVHDALLEHGAHEVALRHDLCGA